MKGGVSQEEPTSDVLHAVNELQADGIAVTLVAHHGRGHAETKGLTEWEDDADQARMYHGTVRDGTTEIEFKKVKSDEDGWSIAVEYTTRELPDGKTTKVAVAGKRKDRSDRRESKTEMVKATMERVAMEVLHGCEPPTMERAELAQAVCRRLDGDLETKEPVKFQQWVRTTARNFGRLKSGGLFAFASKWGGGNEPEILAFTAPGRGRRAGRGKLKIVEKA